MCFADILALEGLLLISKSVMTHYSTWGRGSIRNFVLKWIHKDLGYNIQMLVRVILFQFNVLLGFLIWEGPQISSNSTFHSAEHFSPVSLMGCSLISTSRYSLLELWR